MSGIGLPFRLGPVDRHIEVIDCVRNKGRIFRQKHDAILARLQRRLGCQLQPRALRYIRLCHRHNVVLARPLATKDVLRERRDDPPVRGLRQPNQSHPPTQQLRVIAPKPHEEGVVPVAQVNGGIQSGQLHAGPWSRINHASGEVGGRVRVRHNLGGMKLLEASSLPASVHGEHGPRQWQRDSRRNSITLGKGKDGRGGKQGNKGEARKIHAPHSTEPPPKRTPPRW